MNNYKSILTITLFVTTGVAFGGDLASRDISEPAVQGEIELAQPQPDVPVCSRCNLGKGKPAINDDDALNMIVDPYYEGYITDVVLITYDISGSDTTHTFSSSVIADLNDNNTNITTVYVDAPDAVSAELDWSYSTGSGFQTNVITVN